MLNAPQIGQGPETREEPAVLSISDLAGGLRRLVETNYAGVWVEGEISGFKRYAASGHCYFTLKDAVSQIKTVMWRTSAAGLFFEPRDGMLVHAFGRVSVYEPRGELQLVVSSMKPAGEGALQQALEALKRKLQAEGLFDARYKKAIPVYPEVIGLVTSGEGAAMRDLLSIIGRRYPNVLVVVAPVRVQGVGSAQAVAAAVDAFCALPEGSELRPDTLIVARGGGSIEDLWAFNEEIVARSIFRCTIPVISAVGHETDFTIADFVADVRAATPSMAAEIATPDGEELTAALRANADYMQSLVLKRIDAHRQHVRHMVESRRFNTPVIRLGRETDAIRALKQRLQHAAAQRVDATRSALNLQQQRLELLNPMLPLERGYARVERDGVRITRADALAGGDRVKLRFQDGSRSAEVKP